MTDTIRFTLDGQQVTAEKGLTIWEVANGRGLKIPHLCHKPAPGYRPDGNCRACMVEVEGERTPVGVIPKRDELLLDGLDDQALADLDTILTIDVDRWREEIGHRQVHLEQFHGLPEEIWEAHRRVAAALDDA